ncbi:MAG: cation-efflux pump [Bdellovibrionaceae bacterium]|nr:cation-efflux pump [Pseudobdellovibrionaceae bacterium]
MSQRRSAATLALGATLFLTAIKFVGAVLSGSVGVLSEGIHSFLDLISAAIAYVAVPRAGEPADEAHPFGHGKIETVSSLLESVLLLGAAGFIAYESLSRWSEPGHLDHSWMAISILVVSIVVSFWVYQQNLRTSKETESMALEVNALHFLSDVLSGLGVLTSLLLIEWTGWTWLDPLSGLGVAVYIFLIGVKQTKRALADLVDVQLPDEELKEIREILSRFTDPVKGIHDLRTRRSGPSRHIDFHLLVCKYLTVEESHSICDRMEKAIEVTFPSAETQIHVEPCDNHEKQCPYRCDRIKGGQA